MRRYYSKFGLSLAALLLSSCGVPQLYSPAARPVARSGKTSVDADVALAPKVDDVTDEIACEIGAASAKQLHGAAYNIQVLLTLEVDDNLDLTPSFTLTNPLAVAGEMETNTLNADLGGGRMRTFTTSYYLDSQKLPSDPCDTLDRKSGGKLGKKRLYTLTGDLGIDEVARDGWGVLQKDVQKPDDGTLKPNFGSTVQFTVTKQITALGPLWTLKRFKGPSGNNGLINGKRVRTDKLVVTFTPRTAATPTARQMIAGSQVSSAKGQRDAAVRAVAIAQGRVSAAVAGRARLRVDAERQRSRDMAAALRLNQDIVAATDEERSARDDLTRANEERRRAEAALSDAQAQERVAAVAAQEQSDEATRLAGQTLLQAILLQNATLQPR